MMSEKVAEAAQILAAADPARPFKWGVNDWQHGNAADAVFKRLDLDESTREERAALAVVLGARGIETLRDRLMSTPVLWMGRSCFHMDTINLTLAAAYSTIVLLEIPTQRVVEAWIAHPEVDMNRPQAACVRREIERNDWWKALDRLICGDPFWPNPLDRWAAPHEVHNSIDGKVAKGFVGEFIASLTALLPAD
jgi:hypothetical protein